MKIRLQIFGLLGLGAVAAVFLWVFSAGPSVATAQSIAGTAQMPVPSWPPDTNAYVRDAILEDLSPDVRGTGPGIFVIDVNSFNTNDGSEPSLAIDPSNTNTIVVHGGFGGFSINAPLFSSINGGTSWSVLSAVPAPPGASGTSGCPCDTTIDFGPGSLLAGAFLTFDSTLGTNVFSGSNTAANLSDHTK